MYYTAIGFTSSFPVQEVSEVKRHRFDLYCEWTKKVGQCFYMEFISESLREVSSS